MEPSFQPNGYRHLGLAASDVVGSWRANVSTARLRERVERFERKNGLPRFEARGLDRLPSPLAFELAHLHVALRRKFPAVEVDFVNFADSELSFSGPSKHPVLAYANPYYENYPTLHGAARTSGVLGYRELAEAAEHGSIDEEELAAQLLRESQAIRRDRSAPRDLRTTGSIALSQCFGHARCYGGLRNYWARKTEIATQRGTAPRIMPIRISEAGFVYVHEFGHLVDAAVNEAGASAAQRVYGELSVAVLQGGTGPRPSTRRWVEHLINYPTIAPTPGPHAGGTARRKIIQRSLSGHIAHSLGRYASVNRDELFAESFALAFSAKDRDLVSMLRQFRDAAAAVCRA